MGIINPGMSQSAVEALIAAAIANETGPWEPVTLSPVLEEASEEHQTVRCRFEDNKSVCRLRGAVKIKLASEILAGALIMTLPVGFRPAALVHLSMGSSALNEQIQMAVKPNGEVINANSVPLITGTTLRFDGATFNLT